MIDACKKVNQLIFKFFEILQLHAEAVIFAG